MIARLGLCLGIMCSLLGAGESLQITFTPTDAGGEYGALYCQAVWVETPAGEFVKTIGDWSAARRSRLSCWQSVAGTADADAVMGATINGYATPATLTATWDMTYRGGAAVPDGTYRIWLETTNENQVAPHYAHSGRFGANIASLTVVKDGAPVLAPQSATLAGFQNVTWIYTGRAPVIAAEGQPAARSVVAGTTATFSVTASGGTLGYQWSRNGVAIPGATSATYTTPTTVLGDSGAVFTCAVANGDGGVTTGGVTVSRSATLTVTSATTPPSIVTAPISVSVNEGQPASFTVVAGGTAPLTYQWQRNGVDIAGATQAGYTIPATVRASDHLSTYHCVVRGTGAPAISADATLSVNHTPVTIATQTRNRVVDLGQGNSVTFHVAAVGSPPLAYQWRKGTSPIAGATSPSYTKTGVVIGDNGSSYSCVVSGVDAAGNTANVTSATINLVVGQAPVITTQPVAASTTAGGSASFSIATTPTSPAPGRTWYRNGTIVGYGSPLSLTSVDGSCNGDVYYCHVGNPFGEIDSSPVVLSVSGSAPAGTAPTIVTQPAAATSEGIGWQSKFFVVAYGPAPLTYQWYKGATAGTCTTSIPGATSRVYATPPTTATDGNTYYKCVVTNGTGFVTSNAVLHTIHNPPTFTLQPAAMLSRLVGGTDTLSVTTVGTATVTYQWYRNGSPIAGATSSSYPVPALTAADDGASYHCIASNAYASTYSTPCVVSVLAIASQPQSQSVTAGQTAAFAVAATGSSLGYQWKKNGTAIGGATAATYTTPATVLADNGAIFTCTVTNAAGSVTSSNAILTVSSATVAPSITGQPSAVTRTEGQTATFSVTAGGTAPLTYQWQRNGADIGGATSASYTTPATVLADSGASFTCTVTNAVGSVTSNPAILTVNPAPPAITGQPSGQTVNPGQTATFAVVASGSAPLAYQWKRNGTNITGATSASYTTPAAVLADDGASFTCTVTNAANSITSNAAVLTVQAPPAITADPADQTVSAGATATFTVTATGSPALGYQWTRNGAAIAGATAASYTTPAATGADDGAVFACTVSNAFGNATSAGATLTVHAAPAISVQPVAVTVTAPATATFSLTASGTAPLAYQWRKDGTDIVGATAASYATPATAFADDGAVFTCVVSNAYGSATSSGATLTVHAAPSIATQPADQVVDGGQAATFSVVATGSTAMTYRWRKNGVNISGATSPSYTTPATVLADSGALYSCRITNPYGSATSVDAVLTVRVAPAISLPPSATAVVIGQSATFSVVASGSPVLTYQWYRDGIGLAGATAADYTTPATTLADDGAQFTCVVGNAFGSATSPAAALQVTATAIAPAIATQPSALTVLEGQPATFNVVATGTAPLTYQWTRDGLAIAGATAASYAIPAAALADSGGAFACDVSNVAGSVSSVAGILTVTPASPVITLEPEDQTVSAGASATFTVVATGSAPLTYQWLLGGVAIPGATAASYTTPATTLVDDGGAYVCQVDNGAGRATSVAAVLTVLAAPAIVTPPAASAVSAGTSATFTVVATGSAPLSYQWYRDGVAIPGATAASHATPAAVIADDGAVFTCVVSNPYGSATSGGAVLTVQAVVGARAYIGFTPSPAGGPYAPSHVLAAWIETDAGAFVRTVGNWSGIRRSSLTQWLSRSGGGDVDAVMGATRVAMAPVADLVWDLDVAGTGLPAADGAYRLWIELVDADIPAAGTASVGGARRTSVPFTIVGGQVPSVGPLSQDGFSGITITTTPQGAPVVDAEPTAGGVGSCGGGAVYGLILIPFLSLRRRRR